MQRVKEPPVLAKYSSNSLRKIAAVLSAIYLIGNASTVISAALANLPVGIVMMLLFTAPELGLYYRGCKTKQSIFLLLIAPFTLLKLMLTNFLVPHHAAEFLAFLPFVGMWHVLKVLNYQRLQDAPVKQPAEPIRYVAEYVPLNFQNIAGMDEIKKRLKRAGQDIVGQAVTVQPMTNSVLRLIQFLTGWSPVAHTEEQGSGKTVRNGIMLFGEPGNGKTVFAGALAGELGLPVMVLTYGSAASKWVNETTENVAKAFRDARAQTPCVMFIDEFDSFSPSRDTQPNGGNEETQRLTNTILTEIVALRGTGVVLIAATNYLDRLDAAATREGRFDFKIEVTPPDQEARIGILEKALRKNLPSVVVQRDAINRAASRWEGFSVKRIQAVAEELAAMNEDSPVQGTFDELTAALRRVQGRKGSIPTSTKSLSELILSEDLRQQLQTIAARMKDIERVERMGGTVPGGLLFFGPAGTGKTETARALAKESGFAFLAVSGNDLIADPGNLDRIVDDAANIRPCIVFIDEADDVLANRTSSPFVTVTNKLLAVMDGAGGKTRDVVFIAATNHPERMDPAALRGGRFTEKIYFDVPDAEGLAHYIEGWVAKTPAKFASDLTPVVIANLLSGSSIANTAAILQESVNRMIGRTAAQPSSQFVVSGEDILGAKKTVLN